MCTRSVENVACFCPHACTLAIDGRAPADLAGVTQLHCYLEIVLLITAAVSGEEHSVADYMAACNHCPLFSLEPPFLFSL